MPGVSSISPALDDEDPVVLMGHCAELEKDLKLTITTLAPHEMCLVTQKDDWAKKSQTWLQTAAGEMEGSWFAVKTLTKVSDEDMVGAEIAHDSPSAMIKSWDQFALALSDGGWVGVERAVGPDKPLHMVVKAPFYIRYFPELMVFKHGHRNLLVMEHMGGMVPAERGETISLSLPTVEPSCQLKSDLVGPKLGREFLQVHTHVKGSLLARYERSSILRNVLPWAPDFESVVGEAEATSTMTLHAQLVMRTCTRGDVSEIVLWQKVLDLDRDKFGVYRTNASVRILRHTTGTLMRGYPEVNLELRLWPVYPAVSGTNGVMMVPSSATAATIQEL